MPSGAGVVRTARLRLRPSPGPCGDHGLVPALPPHARARGRGAGARRAHAVASAARTAGGPHGLL